MKTTTPPPSDAIAPSDAALAQAFREYLPAAEHADTQQLMAQIERRAREIAAQPGEGECRCKFDEWQENPYTKVLMKSIVEDYQPRNAASPPHVADALDGERWREIRERICIRRTEMVSGNYRDCFEFEVGGAVPTIPCRAREGFLDPAKFDLRKRQVDAAIAARAEAGLDS